MSMEHPVTQGSEAWTLLRRGKVTASEADRLVSPLWKVRTGQGPVTYLYEKIAERLCGWHKEFGTYATEQGHIGEPDGIGYYELLNEVKVRRIGFVTDDRMRWGASPDGLVGVGGGVEIKNPQAPKHIEYLLANEIPEDYRVQVQFSLFITGRAWWDFVSYSRKLPPLIVRAHPIAEAQQAIAKALEAHEERLTQALSQIDALSPQFAT